MNSTQQKFRQLPAWGSTKVINSIQQHYIVYSYTLHKKHLDEIKVDPTKKMIDNSEPICYKEKQDKLNQTKSRLKLQPLSAVGGKNKPEREKHLEQDIENGSLINRMLQITEKGSLYNKDLLEKQIFRPDKNNYATHRKKEAYKVNKDNLLIHNRLEKVSSTISFSDYQKQYDKYKKYKDNITRSSRRIFNCFIKTDQNKELLATSSTAYGKFLNSNTFSAGTTPSTKNVLNKDHSKTKKKHVKSKNFKTEEDVEFHKFPEDSIEQQSIGSDQLHENEKQDNNSRSKRNSQTNITTKNHKNNQEANHSKRNSNADKQLQQRKDSDQAHHIKIQEQQQIQEDSKVEESNNIHNAHENSKEEEHQQPILQHDSNIEQKQEEQHQEENVNKEIQQDNQNNEQTQN